ncbi:MAG: DUF106 domain-containing protein [Candidatus Aenigmarchaeota archaeon]|nr:DUF106 domain-containing protein [Candidatus Aenigmarchaeota archaeon]
MVFDGLISAFATLMNPVFSPLLVFHPAIALMLFAVFMSLVIFGINKVMIDKKVAKDVKNKLAEVRENLTKAQKEGRKEDINKFLNEYMKINNQYMKQMLKVVVVSTIVVIFLFPWVPATFGDTAVAALPFSLPFIGSGAHWIFWYLLISLASSWLLRKFIGE